MNRPASAERPATRPGAATFLVVLLWLAVAISLWGIVNVFRLAQAFADSGLGYSILDGSVFIGSSMPPVFQLGVHVMTLIGGVICAPLIMKGKAGGRVFGIIWSILCVLCTGFLLTFNFVDYFNGYYDFTLPGQTNPAVSVFAWGIGKCVLALVIFVLLLTPGVRAWTPANPATALIMMVPMGQPQAPQQPGPYGQQQGGYPQQQPQQGYQQQPPYPPQY